MSSFEGILRKSPFGGASWTLECADGQKYQIDGGAPEKLGDGTRVIVEGKVDKEAVSLAMTGPIIRATSIAASG
jgi:hypothetical protein